MGGGYPSGASQTDDFYTDFNLIRNRSFGEMFFWHFQWSAAMDSIMAFHVETIWNHQNAWDAIWNGKSMGRWVMGSLRCMSAWGCECMRLWMHEVMSAWGYECMRFWLHELMSAWVHVSSMCACELISFSICIIWLSIRPSASDHRHQKLPSAYLHISNDCCSDDQCHHGFIRTDCMGFHGLNLMGSIGFQESFIGLSLELIGPD